MQSSGFIRGFFHFIQALNCSFSISQLFMKSTNTFSHRLCSVVLCHIHRNMHTWLLACVWLELEWGREVNESSLHHTNHFPEKWSILCFDSLRVKELNYFFLP